MTDEEPGVHPLASALEQEGFGEAGAVQVTESFARHLMAPSMPGRPTGSTALRANIWAGLRANGKPAGGSTTTAIFCCAGSEQTRPSGMDLMQALATPSWLDPKLGGPRL